METTSTLNATHESSGESSPLRWRMRHLMLVFTSIAVLIVVLFCQPWRLPPQEERIAKLWVMPMPPNSPANAIQQSWNFERSGRCSTHRRGMVGSWHLRDDVLEYSISESGVQGITKGLLYTFGRGPRPRHMKIKWRILEVTDSSLTMLDLGVGPPLKLIALIDK